MPVTAPPASFRQTAQCGAWPRLVSSRVEMTEESLAAAWCVTTTSPVPARGIPAAGARLRRSSRHENYLEVFLCGAGRDANAPDASRSHCQNGGTARRTPVSVGGGGDRGGKSAAC